MHLDETRYQGRPRAAAAVRTLADLNAVGQGPPIAARCEQPTAHVLQHSLQFEDAGADSGKRIQPSRHVW